MLNTLLCLALAAPVQDHVPLPLPAIAAPSSRAALDFPLDGTRLPLPGEVRPQPPAPEASLVPPKLVVDLLAAEARRLGLEARVVGLAGGLFLEGTAAQAAQLSPTLARLEALEAELSIDLELRWDGGEPEPLRLRSGELVALGEAQAQPYLATFEVDVAADSAVADPQISWVHHGRRLLLGAARLPDASGVVVWGLLDHAPPPVLASFDPDTPDLGELEQPVAAGLQLAFAGLALPDRPLVIEALCAEIGDAPLRLEIAARAGALEPDPAEGWAVIDLAALAKPPLALPRLAPRASEDIDPGEAPPVGDANLALDPTGLASLLDSIRPFERNPQWTSTLLFVPVADGPRARQLAMTLLEERVRTETVRIESPAAGLTLSFPTLAGAPIRCAVGTERIRVVDYHTELAPETWMGEPRIERTFDGWACEGSLVAGLLCLDSFCAASNELEPLTARAVGLGRVQRATRRLVRHSVRLAAPATGLLAPCRLSEGDQPGAATSVSRTPQ